MDWITENLLRQREVWHALLTASAGKRNRQAAPEGAEKKSDSPAPAASAAGAEGPRRAVPPAQTPRRAASAAESTGNAAGANARSGRALPAQVSKTGGHPATSDGETFRAELQRRSEIRRQSISGAVAAESREETARSSPSIFRKPLLRARELSQTVERDARRYDGGFSQF